MQKLISLTLAVICAALLTACGGSDDVPSASGTEADTETKLRVGDEFVLQTNVAGGSKQEALYRLYGVTRQGELVADEQAPTRMDGVLVPLLLSETRDGKPADTASSPQALVSQQRAFYKQLWDAVSVHEGSSDPQLILAEVSDLDARIVDAMDDSAASGLTLAQYLDFYDRLDEMPQTASLTYAELHWQEMLSSLDKVSTLQASAPPCPEGLVRVTSVSGLYRYCRESSIMAPGNMAVVLDSAPSSAQWQKVAEVSRSSVSQSQPLIYSLWPWSFFNPALVEKRERNKREIGITKSDLSRIKTDIQDIQVKIQERKQTIEDLQSKHYKFQRQYILCREKMGAEELECLKRIHLAESLNRCEFTLEDYSCLTKLVEQQLFSLMLKDRELRSEQFLDEYRLSKVEKYQKELQESLARLEKLSEQLASPFTGGSSSRSLQAAPAISNEPVHNFPPLAGELRIP